MSAQTWTNMGSVPPAEWLSIEQVIECTGWTRRHIHRLAAAGRIIARTGSTVARNGKREKEYLAASLENIPQQPSLPMVAPIRTIEITAAKQRSLIVSSTDDATARERLELIRPLLELRDSGAAGYFQAIQDRSEKSGISERTLRRWIDRFDEGGLPALSDRQRSDKSSSRWFMRYQKAAYLAAYLYLECKQSFKVCHEAILEDRDLLGIPDHDLPHYDTVRAWLKGMPPYLTTYAREGRKAYRESMSPFLRRAYTDIPANQVWVSDHMIHDVIVMNDCFPEKPFGERIRLRFTALFDYRSRYVVGYSWCWEGSSRSIATAMRVAIEQYGCAEHLYCDNGKDYRKVAKGALPGYLAGSPYEIERWYAQETQRLDELGIMARLGMRVTHCIAHHPQSKHIERFFRTLHERFDKRFHRHYTGGAPHLRPDATTAEMALHTKLHSRGAAEFSSLPRASEFIHAALLWIDEYHRTPQSGEGMHGLSPAQVFESCRGPVRAVDPEDMVLLLPETDRRKVDSCAITLQKRRFVAFDGESNIKLHALNRTEVVVAYDPNSLDAVAILDEGGHLITWAKAEELLRFAPEDKHTQKQIAESMAARRSLEKGTRNTLTEISRVARANGARDRVEQLTQRELPVAVGQVLTHRPAKPQPNHADVAPPSAAEIAATFLEELKK